jgi:PKD repeat protein
MNSDYYLFNSDPSSALYQNFQYDGFVNTLQLQHPVTPGETYSFVIVIADARDAIYDSGVFIKGGSFLGNQPLPAASFEYSPGTQNSIQFVNQSTGARTYEWEFGDGNSSTLENPLHTYDAPGIYDVTLRCSNFCYTEIDTTISVLVDNITGIKVIDNTFYVQTLGDSQYTFKMHQAFGNEKFTLTLYDLSGKQMNSVQLTGAQINEHISDLSSYSQGLYILRVEGNSTMFSHKLIR